MMIYIYDGFQDDYDKFDNDYDYRADVRDKIIKRQYLFRAILTS